MIEIIGIKERCLVHKEDIRFIRGCKEQYFVYVRCWATDIEISREEYFRLVDKLKEGE